jgi:hypothetical protein
VGLSFTAVIFSSTSHLWSRYSDWLRVGRPRGRSSGPSRVKNCLFSTSSRTALGSTQLPIQLVPEGGLSPGVKRPGREVDHSPPARAEVKRHGPIRPLPHTPSWRSAYLVKYRDNFTLFYMSGIFTIVHVGVLHSQLPRVRLLVDTYYLQFYM